MEIIFQANNVSIAYIGLNIRKFRMTEKQRFLERCDESTDDTQSPLFFSLIERVGAMGRYQVWSLVLWCLLAYLTGGLILMTPFLFYQDPYDCSETEFSASCRQYVCSLAPSERKLFIPEPSILSLANKFGDYRCETQMNELDSTIGLMYSGALIGIVMLSIFGDMVGRKKLLLFNMAFTIIGLVLTICSQNLLMAGWGMFMAIMGIKASHNITFIFISETVHQSFRHKFSTGIELCFTLGGCCNIIWYYLFSSSEIILISFYAVPALLTTIVIAFFVKDTPISMLTKFTPEKAYKDLQHIARANRFGQTDLSVSQIEDIQQSYRQSVTNPNSQVQKPKSFSIIDLFRYKSLRTMTILLVILDLAVALQYYTPTLMLDQFKFNIFINGTVVCSSQIIAGIISFFLISKAKRRSIGCICFFVIFACATTLIFIWDQNSEEVKDINSNIVVLMLIFVLEFAISVQFSFFMIYVNQLLPTQVKIVGFGFIQIFGALVLVGSKWLISFCLNNGIKIMIIFAALAAICIICSYLLPQTHGKIPPEQIQELSNDGRDKEASVITVEPKSAKA